MEETVDDETLLTLPYEMQVETLIHVPYYDLLRFCATSTTAWRICADEDFWKLKIRRDFGDRYPDTIYERPLPGDTWKQKYTSYFAKMGTDLMFAAQDGRDADVEDILSFGINPHLRKEINTALEIAAESSLFGIVETLLAAGADPNETTALLRASNIDRDDIVQILLEYGADIDMQDAMGRTALMVASVQGHIEMVQFLLDSGADLHLKSDLGADALIVAASGGHPDLVRVLLASGANPYVKTNTGHTALRFAEYVTGPTSELSYVLRRALRYPFTLM